MAYSQADPLAARKLVAKPGEAANPAKGLLRDIPNSRQYSTLRELELRIDQYINRKKAEICDVTQPAIAETRQLRLYVYNQHNNQADAGPSNPPSWSLFIYGHFVDSGQVLLPQPTPTQRVEAKKVNRWTEAMSSIEIRVEERGEHAAVPEVVRWERARHMGAHRECVELHRCGNKPAKVTITMVRDFVPERFTVTGGLRDVVSSPVATRGQVLQAVWRYVQFHSTPDPVDHAWVVCDAALQKLFDISSADPRLHLPSLSDRILGFLQLTQPIVIEYELELQGPSPSSPACYDVEVSVPLKEVALKLPPFLERLAKDRELQACSEEISRNMKALQECHQRFNFLTGFASGPVQCIQHFMAAAAKETRVASTGTEYKQISGSEHYKMPWAQEAVMKYLMNYSTAGNI